ncbi:MAG TPA: MFS transporter [Chloroflexota bacterium]|jgi:MFS family permease|nr:MFS transporter [Chloroflexota bacterium]
MSSLWRDRDFLKLWAGQTISLAGSMVGGFALPLVAVLTLEASPLQLGLLRVADILPAIVVGLFVGVWVDRLPRRPIMVAVDLGRALLLATIPAAALLGRLRIEQLYAVAVLVGALTLLFDVAYRSYLPTLVGRAALVEGNARISASSSVVEVAGFGAAGALVQLLTAPLAILVDAVSFVASAVSLLLIRRPEPPRAPSGGGPGAWREMREGLSVVARQPVLRALALAEGSNQLFVHMWVAMLLLFLTRELRFEPILFGPLFAIGGVSSLAGALVAERLIGRFGVGPTIVSCWTIGTASLLFVPLAGGPVVLAAALVGAAQCFDAAGTIGGIGRDALVQGTTPDRRLGRVNASLQMVRWGAMLAGSLIGGLLGETIGVRETMFVGALGALPSALWLVFSPIPRIRATSAPTGEPAAA